MSADDPFGLQRFVAAQDDGSYEQALRELRAGHKRSHWIWFVFPQVAGLGSSPPAEFFGISGLGEARAYLAHPILGPRLLECARTLAGLADSDPVRVMGSGIDAVKLRSSMTLFARAAPGEEVFADVLNRYFEGELDPMTLNLLEV
jgi:uncharacterized protein (DUF1810 family)